MMDIYLVLTQRQIQESIQRQNTQMREERTKLARDLKQRDHDDYNIVLNKSAYHDSGPNAHKRKNKKFKQDEWDF